MDNKKVLIKSEPKETIAMNALLLLFITNIALLWIALRLFRQYLKAYNSLYTADPDEALDATRLFQLQNDSISHQEARQAIDTIIHKRLADMDQQFPTAQIQEESSGEVADLLTLKFKRMLSCSLNLLKF